MTDFGKRTLIAATILACTVQLARASEPPADVCSMLPAAEVSKVLGAAYEPPRKSVAPRPYQNTAEGTDCNYQPKGHGSKLWFRVYLDPSPSAATDLFARLRMFYGPPTPISGVGDEAYFDPRHGIHVRKGKVRFFLSFSDTDRVTTTNENQFKDLASQVAGRL